MKRPINEEMFTVEQLEALVKEMKERDEKWLVIDYFGECDCIISIDIVDKYNNSRCVRKLDVDEDGYMSIAF